MKKVLWMMALTMCLVAAGCSKDDAIEPKVEPVMTDEQIEKALVGTAWHIDELGISNWSFSTSRISERDYIDYYYGSVRGLRYFYGTYAKSQSGDAYGIRDGAVHIGYQSKHGGHVNEYSAWCTLTPLTISAEEMTAVVVYHSTKSAPSENAEKPMTVRFLRGKRD